MKKIIMIVMMTIIMIGCGKLDDKGFEKEVEHGKVVSISKYDYELGYYIEVSDINNRSKIDGTFTGSFSYKGYIFNEYSNPLYDAVLYTTRIGDIFVSIAVNDDKLKNENRAMKESIYAAKNYYKFKK